MPDANERFQKEYSVQLAAFIVGCLVFEEVIKIDHEAIRAPGTNEHHQYQMQLDAAIRVVSKCLEGRLSDELDGLPFEW